MPKRRVTTTSSQGITCPECDHPDSSVLNVRSKEGRIYRRRVCRQCNQRFSTLELYYAKPYSGGRDVANEERKRIVGYAEIDAENMAEFERVTGFQNDPAI